MEYCLRIDMRRCQIDAFNVLDVIYLNNMCLTWLCDLSRVLVNADDISIVRHLVPLMEARQILPFLYLSDIELLKNPPLLRVRRSKTVSNPNYRDSERLFSALHSICLKFEWLQHFENLALW